MTEIAQKVTIVLDKIAKMRSDEPSVALLAKICREIYTDHFDPMDMMNLMQTNFKIVQEDGIINFSPMTMEWLAGISKNVVQENVSVDPVTDSATNSNKIEEVDAPNYDVPSPENVRIRLMFSDNETDVYIYVEDNVIGISTPI